MSEEKIKEVTEAAASNIKPEMEQVDDIKGVKQLGKPIVASSSGNTYYLRPCSLENTPRLVLLVKNLEKQFQGKDLNDISILADPKSNIFDIMADIIIMGFENSHPELNKSKLLKEFALKDFPIVYKETLALNDFLLGMGNLYQ